MNVLTMLNRSISTAQTTFPNDRRSVSEMDDDQRKAVMAKLGGGGGYTGKARGGGSPMRKQRAKFAQLSHEMEMRRQGQMGLQSDLTPIDLLASTAIESGLESISQARLNTDNKWADAALGAVALGLLAAGIKNARSDARLAKSLTAKKNFDEVLEQMGRDAERFKPIPDPTGTPKSSPVGDDIYHTYDKLAERVTRARGYPPSDAEANRWLDKVAPRVDSLPPSRAGDVFRAEAAKSSGSLRGQYLDYARRADLDAVAPRMAKDPATRIGDVINDLLPYKPQFPKGKPITDFGKAIPPLSKPQNIVDQAWNNTLKRAAQHLDVDLADPSAVKNLDRALSRVKGNFWKLNSDLTVRPRKVVTNRNPFFVTLANAIRVSSMEPVITNFSGRGPMTDEQRKAMFAGMGSGGRGRGPTDSRPIAPTKQENLIVSKQDPSKTMTPFQKWVLTPQASNPGDDRMITPPNAGQDYYDAKMVALYERFLRENPYDQNPPAAWLKQYPDWKPKQNPNPPRSYPGWPEMIAIPTPIHQPAPPQFGNPMAPVPRQPTPVTQQPRVQPSPPLRENPWPPLTPIYRGGPYNPGGPYGAIRSIQNAVRVVADDSFIANAGPMSDDQRKAMFAKAGGPGGRGFSSTPHRGPTTMTRSPASMSSLPLYTRPDLNRIDQGIGLPGSERPSRKIDFASFDSLFENFKNTFPQDHGGIATQMDSLLRPFRDNPTAFFDDPKAVDQLFNLVARSIVGNTGSKNYETKRGALESSFYSEGLKILQAAGLMQGWVAHSTFGKDGFPGVRFWNERPTTLQFYESGMKSGPTSSFAKTIKSPVYSGGSSSSRAGSNTSQAPRTSTGGYAPRQSYPGGPVFYGPKPGEQGFIDINQWRSGAQPKIPGKPTTNPKTDTYIRKNRSTRDLLFGGIATTKSDFVMANAGPMTDSQRKAMFASKASPSSGYIPPTTRGRIPPTSGYNRNEADVERQLGSGMDRAAALKEAALVKLSAAQKLLKSIPLGTPSIPSKGIIPKQNELQPAGLRYSPGMKSIGDLEMQQMRDKSTLERPLGEVGIGDFERRQFESLRYSADPVWQKRMDELQGILAQQKQTQERWGYGGQIEGAENLIKAHLEKRGKYTYTMPVIDPQTAKKRNQAYKDDAYAKRMAAKDETIQKLLAANARKP